MSGIRKNEQLDADIEYLYRVVSRSPDGEWGPVDTGKRVYFSVGTARATRGVKQKEWDSMQRHRERYLHMSHVPDPEEREFAVARIPVGNWEVIPDDHPQA